MSTSPTLKLARTSVPNTAEIPVNRHEEYATRLFGSTTDSLQDDYLLAPRSGQSSSFQSISNDLVFEESDDIIELSADRYLHINSIYRLSQQHDILFSHSVDPCQLQPSEQRVITHDTEHPLVIATTNSSQNLHRESIIQLKSSTAANHVDHNNNELKLNELDHGVSSKNAQISLQIGTTENTFNTLNNAYNDNINLHIDDGHEDLYAPNTFCVQSTLPNNLSSEVHMHSFDNFNAFDASDQEIEAMMGSIRPHASSIFLPSPTSLARHNPILNFKTSNSPHPAPSAHSPNIRIPQTPSGRKNYKVIGSNNKHFHQDKDELNLIQTVGSMLGGMAPTLTPISAMLQPSSQPSPLMTPSLNHHTSNESNFSLNTSQSPHLQTCHTQGKDTSTSSSIPISLTKQQFFNQNSSSSQNSLSNPQILLPKASTLPTTSSTIPFLATLSRTRIQPVTHNSDSFAEYEIIVIYPPLTWTVWHRYSDFEALYNELIKSPEFMKTGQLTVMRAPNENIEEVLQNGKKLPVPKLPRKKLFNNLKLDFIEDRRASLCVWWDNIMPYIDILLKNTHFLEFIGMIKPSEFKNPVKEKKYLKHIKNNSLYIEMLLQSYVDVGDIFLFHTNGLLQSIQRNFFKNGYDHVGVVVRVPDYSQNLDGLYLFESTNDGVQLYPLRRRLYAWNESGAHIVYRQLNATRTREMKYRLYMFVQQNENKPYSISTAKVFRNKYMNPNYIVEKPAATDRSSTTAATPTTTPPTTPTPVRDNITNVENIAENNNDEQSPKSIKNIHEKDKNSEKFENSSDYDLQQAIKTSNYLSKHLKCSDFNPPILTSPGYFCSELVAFCWLAMNAIINPERPPASYLPASFSDAYTNSLPFLNGVSLEPETLVIFKVAEITNAYYLALGTTSIAAQGSGQVPQLTDNPISNDSPIFSESNPIDPNSPQLVPDTSPDPSSAEQQLSPLQRASMPVPHHQFLSQGRTVPGRAKNDTKTAIFHYQQKQINTVKDKLLKSLHLQQYKDNFITVRGEDDELDQIESPSNTLLLSEFDTIDNYTRPLNIAEYTTPATNNNVPQHTQLPDSVDSSPPHPRPSFIISSPSSTTDNTPTVATTASPEQNTSSLPQHSIFPPSSVPTSSLSAVASSGSTKSRGKKVVFISTAMTPSSFTTLSISLKSYLSQQITALSSQSSKGSKTRRMGSPISPPASLVKKKNNNNVDTLQQPHFTDHSSFCSSNAQQENNTTIPAHSQQESHQFNTISTPQVRKSKGKPMSLQNKSMVSLFHTAKESCARKRSKESLSKVNSNNKDLNIPHSTTRNSSSTNNSAIPLPKTNATVEPALSPLLTAPSIFNQSTTSPLPIATAPQPPKKPLSNRQNLIYYDGKNKIPIINPFLSRTPNQSPSHSTTTSPVQSPQPSAPHSPTTSSSAIVPGDPVLPEESPQRRLLTKAKLFPFSTTNMFGANGQPLDQPPQNNTNGDRLLNKSQIHKLKSKHQKTYAVLNSNCSGERNNRNNGQSAIPIPSTPPIDLQQDVNDNNLREIVVDMEQFENICICGQYPHVSFCPLSR